MARARGGKRGAGYAFHALTPDRWDDLARLFGPKGACGGCWCMWWRATPTEFRAGRSDGNRRALRALVRSGAEPGVLAYDGDEPVGWCAIAPREAYPRLGRSRVMAPVDERPVWSVTCFYVAKDHLGRGLSVALLHAAARFAAERGARIVEGYPIEPGARQPDPFVYTGIASAFRAAGFLEVVRRSPSRPVMRRSVRKPRSR
jgi:GNAT superfamily N-acetyltransferase